MQLARRSINELISSLSATPETASVAPSLFSSAKGKTVSVSVAALDAARSRYETSVVGALAPAALPGNYFTNTNYFMAS